MVMPMSLIILKDECPRYCSFIVSPRKYRYILLWIGCDVNNNIAQLLAKWLNFGIKVGNLGAKNIFLDGKVAFFKK